MLELIDFLKLKVLTSVSLSERSTKTKTTICKEINKTEGFPSRGSRVGVKYLNCNCK